MTQFTEWVNEFGISVRADEDGGYALALDEGGREHKGKGSGGGQFVGKGVGTSSAPAPKPKSLLSRVLGAVGLNREPLKPTADYSTPEQVEAMLTAKPTQVKPLTEGGINYTFIVELEGGIKGVWKPKNGEARAAVSNVVPHGTAHNREAASSEVAAVLGLSDLVPPTVNRELPHQGEGSLQRFLPSDGVAIRHGDKKRFDGPKDLARAAAFDFVTGQVDRHASNWLVRGDSIALIDSGASFPTKNEPGNGANGAIIQRAMADNLPVPAEAKEWAAKWPQVEESLKKHGIEQEAIDIARHRVEALANSSTLSEAIVKSGYQSVGFLAQEASRAHK